MSNKELIASVERLFTADYLFDPIRSSWRQLVCPEDIAENEQPPEMSLSTLLSFIEIRKLCTGATDTVKLKTLADVLSNGSKLVVIKNSGENLWKVRRAEVLKDAENPSCRTVFVKPVPADATDAEISNFFSKFGTVEVVIRNTFTDGQAERRKASALVRFASVSDATRCIETKPTLGKLESDFANRYVPRLTVVMQEVFQKQVSEEARNAEEQQLKRNVIKADMQASASNGEGKVTKFLMKGCTLKVENVPQGETWATIKAKLGNLAEKAPELKGAITLVRLDQNKQVAYVVLKTPAAASALLTAYASQSDVVPELKRICPQVEELSGAEESIVIQQFPEWAATKVNKKRSSNQKRPRD